MKNLLSAEHLKYKRTFARKLMVLAPSFFVLVALTQRFLMPGFQEQPWEFVLALVYNWWPVLFLPLGLALVASLTESQEKRAGNYKGIRTRFVSPQLLWISKILVVVYYALLTTVVLVVVVLVFGLLIAHDDVPWRKILVGGLLLWLTALPIIPLQLWVAHRGGTLASMLVGIFGFVAGVLGAPESYWFCIPWSWPTRLMSPLIGVHPNGMFLEATSSLLDPAVIPLGIGLSLITFLVLTGCTGLSFSHQGVKV